MCRSFVRGHFNLTKLLTEIDRTENEIDMNCLSCGYVLGMKQHAKLQPTMITTMCLGRRNEVAEDVLVADVYLEVQNVQVHWLAEGLQAKNVLAVSHQQQHLR